MSYNKELAINILKQIEKAIQLIQNRTLEIAFKSCSSIYS